MGKLKDWMAIAVPAVTVFVGMAWSSGVRDQKIDDLKGTVAALSAELKELRGALYDLRVEVAKRTQGIKRGE